MSRCARASSALAVALVPSVTLFGCGGDGDTTTTAVPTTTPVTTKVTTKAPEPLATCEQPMPGLDCVGADLEQHYEIVEHSECCDKCTANPNCAAYTHTAQDKTCYLKWWCNYLKVVEPVEKNSTAAVKTKLPPHPQPTCAVPTLGIGYVCQGDDVGGKHATKSEECCSICMATEGCLIFSWSKSQNMCYMKKNCPVKTENGDFTTGWVPPKNQQALAQYEVGRGYYDLAGYKCGGGSGATVIFYPMGPGPFNVVVYGHGAWGFVDGSDNWLETVASLGLIVIAPFQGKDKPPAGSLKLTGCKTKFADDLLNALSGSKAGGATLHPALATADWSRTGVFGHSKGAKYAPLAASKGKLSHNITAMMASCDTPASTPKHTVASMFTTGTLDKFNVDDEMLHYYQNFKGTPKVYLNIKDAYHMEVQEGMRANVVSAQFLSCHVGNNQKHCDVIYGQGPESVCKVNDYKDCMVTPAGAARVVV